MFQPWSQHEPAPPGKDRVPLPDHEPIRTSTTLTHRDETMAHRVDIAPHDVGTPILLADCYGDYSSHGASMSQRHQGRIGSLSRIKNPSVHLIYNRNTPGTKTMVHRVDIAPHSVETPTPGIPLLARTRAGGGPSHWRQDGSVSLSSVI